MFCEVGVIANTQYAIYNLILPVICTICKVSLKCKSIQVVLLWQKLNFLCIVEMLGFFCGFLFYLAAINIARVISPVKWSKQKSVLGEWLHYSSNFLYFPNSTPSAMEVWSSFYHSLILSLVMLLSLASWMLADVTQAEASLPLLWDHNGLVWWRIRHEKQNWSS